MRELNGNEICCVSGAVSFTTPVTATLLNNVANAGTVAKLVGAAFGVGYAIGTWLDNRYSISTRIADFL